MKCARDLSKKELLQYRKKRRNITNRIADNKKQIHSSSKISTNSYIKLSYFSSCADTYVSNTHHTTETAEKNTRAVHTRVSSKILM